MTSGVFHSIPIQSITIHRETRQRRDLGDINNLADSIKRLGLIHPPVVTREHILVAGERRVSACRMLGWDRIPAQYVDELDQDELELIELEENIKRRDLSWQEQNDAMARVYEIRKREMPEASNNEIAARMGIDAAGLSHHLAVKRERAINPHIDDAATYSTALKTTQAAIARRAASDSVYTMEPIHGIYHRSFHDWAPTYAGPKFDVLHIDFPYGIASQDSGINPSGYDDSIHQFSLCCLTLTEHLDRFCAPSAHIIFWFSLSNDYLTQKHMISLREKGFQFDELPLIWHKSDGRGIAPDPSRRPRRVYETAWFGWRGDRRLVRLRDNLFAAPGAGGIHPHEKSELAMHHFLEMVVDSTTSVLDPTCGSGSALRAAKALGARRVLGLEQDKQYAEDAQRLLMQVLP